MRKLLQAAALCAVSMGTFDVMAQSSTAMNAWYLNLNGGPGGYGSGCWAATDPPRMPAGRTPCSFAGQVVLQTTGTGQYTLSVANAAPFPSSTSDVGHYVAVSTIGGNAHCYEESTSASGNNLISRIRCVAPSNSDNPPFVNSQFSWLYRTDSFAFSQSYDLPENYSIKPNFGYARITKTGAVHAESFNSINAGITATRIAAGRYQVTFTSLDFHTFAINPDFALNNVVVSKICRSTDPTSCRRNVCTPFSWDDGGAANTKVEVRCYNRLGALTDTEFRVFTSDEAINSGGGPDEFGDQVGSSYAWVNWFNQSAPTGCTNWESPLWWGSNNAWLGSPSMQVCRDGTGDYRAIFNADRFWEDFTGARPIVTSRGTGGSYCNVGSFANDPTRVRVRCYNASGSAVNSAWNLSLWHNYQ